MDSRAVIVEDGGRFSACRRNMDSIIDTLFCGKAADWARSRKDFMEESMLLIVVLPAVAYAATRMSDATGNAS